MEEKTYTVYDVIRAEYTLEPLKCIHCDSTEAIEYAQYIGDAYCAVCGKWQLEEAIEYYDHKIYSRACP
jgi:hypothetical protein